TEVLCGHWPCSGGGYPKGIRRGARSKKNGSRLVQIQVDGAVQPFWDSALVWTTARFGEGTRQGDPPAPVDLLERVPDLQGREILQSIRADCEQSDHQTVAYPSRPGETLIHELLCLDHQSQTGFHQPLGQHQPVELRSRLHYQRKVLLD